MTRAFGGCLRRMFASISEMIIISGNIIIKILYFAIWFS